MTTTLLLLIIAYLLLLVFFQRHDLKQWRHSANQPDEISEKILNPKSILGETKRHKTTVSDNKRQISKPMAKPDKFVEKNTPEKRVKATDPEEFFPMNEPLSEKEQAEQQAELQELFAEKEVSEEDISLTQKELQAMHRYLKQPDKEKEQTAFQTYRKVETTELVSTLVDSYTQESLKTIKKWNLRILELERQALQKPPQEAKTKTTADTKEPKSDFDIYTYINP